MISAKKYLSVVLTRNALNLCNDYITAKRATIPVKELEFPRIHQRFQEVLEKTSIKFVQDANLLHGYDMDIDGRILYGLYPMNLTEYFIVLMYITCFSKKTITVPESIDLVLKIVEFDGFNVEVVELMAQELIEEIGKKLSS